MSLLPSFSLDEKDGLSWLNESWGGSKVGVAITILQVEVTQLEDAKDVVWEHDLELAEDLVEDWDDNDESSVDLSQEDHGGDSADGT